MQLMSAAQMSADGVSGGIQWEAAADNTHKTLDWLLGTPLQIVGIVLGAMVVRWLVHRAITRVVTRAVDVSKRPEEPKLRKSSRVLAGAAGAFVSERRGQRAETVGSVLRSVATFVIFGLAFVMVLDKLGIPIGPLLASAGVAGVALGFGAQSLVRDFLSGIFMILEDQYGVGDVIDTGSAVGTVEDVSLRVTRLRDGTGVVWYVRNGEIMRVGNHSQGWSTAIVDVAVAYNEDIARVQDVIREVAEAMAEDDDWVEKFVDDPVVAGVESVTGSAVTIRVVAKCKLNEHFGRAARAARAHQGGLRPGEHPGARARLPRWAGRSHLDLLGAVGNLSLHPTRDRRRSSRSIAARWRTTASLSPCTHRCRSTTTRCRRDAATGVARRRRRVLRCRTAARQGRLRAVGANGHGSVVTTLASKGLQVDIYAVSPGSVTVTVNGRTVDVASFWTWSGSG